MTPPQFGFGDIVTVSGYNNRLFQIDGYRIEKYRYPDEEWEDVVYELTDVKTGDWLEADADDLSKVADVTKASEYLAEHSAGGIALLREDTPVTKPQKQPPPPTARERSAKEAEERKQARKARADQIDNLLDIANWNRKMLDKTGDETYGDRLFAVNAELKKLTEKD